MKKNKICLIALGSILAIGLTACGNGDNSGSTKPSNNPFVPGGNEGQNATELLAAALQKDYSNMTVVWESYTRASDAGEVGYLYYYKDYMIMAPTTEFDTTYLYYHDYQGETYLYFTPDSNYVGEGQAPEAWLKNGYNDVSLDPSIITFVMKNFLSAITPEICTYEASLGAFFVNSDVVERTGLKILGFAWDNNVDQIMFNLDDQGFIHQIRGFDSHNEDDYVAVDLGRIGTTYYDDSKLPTAPNEHNVMEYWQYKGLPYKDADKIFLESLNLSKIQVQANGIETCIYDKQLLADVRLAAQGSNVYKGGNYQVTLVEEGEGDNIVKKALFKIGDADEVELAYSSLSTSTVSVYEASKGGQVNKIKLSLVEDAGDLILKSMYEPSTQETVEIDKTVLVGVDMLPIDATITGLVWKSSNPAALAVDNNASGNVVRKGTQQFIAKPVEIDTTVEVWCEAEKARDGQEKAVSNHITFKVKANGVIDKTDAKADLYFTKLADSTSAPSIAKETFETRAALTTAHPTGAPTTDIFYISSENVLVRFYEMNEETNKPRWIELGNCTNTVLTMKDTVEDDNIIAEVGKVQLFDVENANAGLFKGTRKILGFTPNDIGQGHLYPCYAQFSVTNPVTKIMFNYGAIYSGDLIGLHQLDKASIDYSADGITWESIDILEDIQSDLSINTLRLMEKDLTGIPNVKHIRISFHSGNIGGQLRIGVQNIVLF